MAEAVAQIEAFNWRCRHTWAASARNTFWCLVGCATGDFATILGFQFFAPGTPVYVVMPLAMLNGLLTSIALETVILRGELGWKLALRTALGMSLMSMLGMEAAMNLTDYLLVGAAALTWWSAVPSLAVGFLAPWPYNYWRLKKYGKACH
jgi:hypothetical protein